jgi:hypothetical protein
MGFDTAGAGFNFGNWNPAVVTLQQQLKTNLS